MLPQKAPYPNLPPSRGKEQFIGSAIEFKHPNFVLFVSFVVNCMCLYRPNLSKVAT